MRVSTSGSHVVGLNTIQMKEAVFRQKSQHLQRGNIEFDWSDIQCVSPPKDAGNRREKRV